MMNIVFITIGFALVLFLLLPFNIPPAPQELLNIGNNVADVVRPGVEIMAYIFTPLLLWLALFGIVALFAAKPIYAAVMWVLRKIPILGIK